MPLYDYICTQCRKVAEVRHGFGETYREPCAACGAPMTRVFNAAPIVFKGSGFYKTDSRKASTPESAAASKPDEAKAAGAPAAAPATPAAPAESSTPKASEPAA
jgi:putative FmdB family regulatory protein